ncbi:spore germination protein GerPE [Effusibacillus pohliae]|uniref:spore germination protein GerPE n=1 Tax=Effusibacillus pohliae TaxID=232270 RepID=UPI0003773E04|nr:spore germination protein GerPE [Effusibacillus pohliae]
MAFVRNRPKITHVKAMKVNLVLISAVLQVGDVGQVHAYSRTLSVGGPRGAPSFITQARHIHTATRLHYAEQADKQASDFNFTGEAFPFIGEGFSEP